MLSKLLFITFALLEKLETDKMNIAILYSNLYFGYAIMLFATAGYQKYLRRIIVLSEYIWLHVFNVNARILKR